MSIYLVQGERMDPAHPAFQQALGKAYRHRRRPVCLCSEAGAEMVVARLRDHFVLKRMPLTGDRHARACLSAHEPARPRARSVAAAIEEPPAGMTSIRLGFAMSQGRDSPSDKGRRASRSGVALGGEMLSLGALLSYLWDRASLNEWHPAFAGKRNWAVVRKRLLEASERTLVGLRPLSDLLYIPERFRPADRAGIDARRTKLWRKVCKGSSLPGRFMLLIGEIKRIWPGPRGQSILLKHLPDHVFGVSRQRYQSACQGHGSQLFFRDASQERLMLIATFNPGGQALEINELSLMSVTRNWCPPNVNTIVADTSCDLRLPNAGSQPFPGRGSRTVNP